MSDHQCRFFELRNFSLNCRAYIKVIGPDILEEKIIIQFIGKPERFNVLKVAVYGPCGASPARCCAGGGGRNCRVTQCGNGALCIFK